MKKILCVLTLAATAGGAFAGPLDKTECIAAAKPGGGFDLTCKLAQTALLDSGAITQAEFGDQLGLSTVHVNRTLQELRSEGLVMFRGKELTIPDLALLEQVALFNANYLHLDREGARFDANYG